jgi:hypothetical protein
MKSFLSLLSSVVFNLRWFSFKNVFLFLPSLSPTSANLQSTLTSLILSPAAEETGVVGVEVEVTTTTL